MNMKFSQLKRLIRQETLKTMNESIHLTSDFSPEVQALVKELEATIYALHAELAYDRDEVETDKVMKELIHQATLKARGVGYKP